MLQFFVAEMGSKLMDVELRLHVIGMNLYSLFSALQSRCHQFCVTEEMRSF